MSEKIGAVSVIVKYGVIGGALAGVAYLGYKIWKSFEKAKPPDPTTPPNYPPVDLHGCVEQYKTGYVSLITLGIPQVHYHNTKTDFINHLLEMKRIFPVEYTNIECFSIHTDGYEHYMGRSYQCLNFQNELPETVYIEAPPIEVIESIIVSREIIEEIADIPLLPLVRPILIETVKDGEKEIRILPSIPSGDPTFMPIIAPIILKPEPELITEVAPKELREIITIPEEFEEIPKESVITIPEETLTDWLGGLGYPEITQYAPIEESSVIISEPEPEPAPEPETLIERKRRLLEFL